jgi:hypothetical protein
MLRPSLLLFSFLTAALCASALQAQVKPGFSRKPQPSWMIINSFTSAPGDDIRAVSMWRNPSDPDGTWRACLTVAKLPSFFGGDDKSVGVVIGLFEPSLARFTPSQEASLLNSSADDLHLSVHPQGFWAVFERASGVYVAQRQQLGGSFGTPVALQGIGTHRDVHPHFGRVAGKDYLFYVRSGELVMHEFAAATASLVGSPTVVARPLQSGARLKSGAPLHGHDGDVEGLFLSETPAAGDCDLLWDGDLDPLTPPLMFMQRSDWTNDPTLAGGYLYWAHDIQPRWHLMHSEATWLLGDVEAPGGVLDVTIGRVVANVSTPDVSVIFAAAGHGASFGVAGIGGSFGLDLATMFTLGAALHTSLNGVSALSVPVPNDPSFRGLRLAVQALSVDGASLQGTLSSSAWLRIR